MANYKTHRKVKTIYLSEEALKYYAELQSSGIRVALLIENFVIDLGKEKQKEANEHE
ncbi:MAG: hypothetical protein PHX04_06255 [Bacilli bacterium]|nr:hypothetical protein [Bacilli bacterium]